MKFFFIFAVFTLAQCRRVPFSDIPSYKSFVLKHAEEHVLASMQEEVLDGELERLWPHLKRSSVLREVEKKHSFFPTQVHLGIVAEFGRVSVMWVTEKRCMDSWVSFSTGQQHHRSNGTSSTYNVGLGGFHQWIYYAEMGPLVAGQLVQYSVGGCGGHSPQFRFAAPSSGSAAQTTRTSLALLGDQGTFIPAGFKVKDMMVADELIFGPVDVVHVVGDISYAWGAVPGPEEQWLWDVYQEMMEELASHTPMMVTIGNHELYANCTAFKERFRMPGGPGENYYYSYDVGLVHIVSFSTEHRDGELPGQFDWIVSDLKRANANRHNVPWIVVVTHHPMYSSNSFAYSNHQPGSGEQRTYERLFLDNNVDLMVSGHVHVYERILANINGTVTPDGLPHVVQGTGGAMYVDHWVHPSPPWSAYRSKANFAFGYGRVDANRTHLRYQFRSENKQETLDELVLTPRV